VYRWDASVFKGTPAERSDGRKAFLAVLDQLLTWGSPIGKSLDISLHACPCVGTSLSYHKYTCNTCMQACACVLVRHMSLDIQAFLHKCT